MLDQGGEEVSVSLCDSKLAPIDSVSVLFCLSTSNIASPVFGVISHGLSLRCQLSTSTEKVRYLRLGGKRNMNDHFKLRSCLLEGPLEMLPQTIDYLSYR